MIRVHRAELVAAWPTWLGVAITFITVNFSLAVSALALHSGQVFLAANPGVPSDAQSYVLVPAGNLIFCSLVGAAVIGSSTSLVIDARRGPLARLSLSGATPRQIGTMIVGQLAAISLASAGVGLALAFALLQPVMDFLAFERRQQVDVATAHAQYSPWPALLAGGFCVVIAVVGGLRQTIRGSRVPPVEALRQSQGDGERHMGAGRWVLFSFAVAAISGTFVGARFVEKGFAGLSQHLQLAMTLLIVSGVALAAVAPKIVGPVTRAWTSLVPSRAATWRVARRNTIERSARLSKSVVPVMLTVGLLEGTIALGSVLERSMTASGEEMELTASGWASIFMLMGLPLMVPLAGAIGALMMMARQRDAELALLGLSGATLSQRVRVTLFEGIILAATGVILGTLMSAVAVWYFLWALASSGFTPAAPSSWGTLAIVALACTTILVTAMSIPVIPALRRGEHQVVARLVAD